jgi:hypothetical protein
MTSQNTSETITRTPSDVLCGRGGLSNNHPGNHEFRRLINQNKEFYQACEKPSHKHFVVVSIIRAIRKNGGRFIERKSGVWQEIPVKKAMTKTSQALREQQEHTPPSSKSESSIASAKSEPESNPLSALPTTTLTKPLARRVSDGSASSSTATHEEQERESTPAKSAQQETTTMPETTPSQTNQTSTQPPLHYYQKHSRQEEFSTNVIECEIEQALEEILDDDDFAFRKEYLPVDAPLVAQRPLSSSFQPKGRGCAQTLPAMICSDSDEEGDDNEHDLCPLSISESVFNTVEYAEMCSELVTSFLSSG